jgi:hypothetical protein
MRSSLRLAVPAGMFLLLDFSSAHAQEWIYDPRIELQAIYNDNNRLTAERGQEIEAKGGAIDALVGLRRETQVNTFEATPHIRWSKYPDAGSEDSTDYYFDLKGEHKTQRTTSGIYAGFADESVVTSDLLVADFPGVDLGQTVSGDSGRVSVRNRRRLYSVEPRMEFNWTERRHLTLDAHYVDADYDEQFFEQIGYKDYGASVGIKWNTSQRATFEVDAVGSQFSPKDNSPDTTTGGIIAEWRMAPSTITNYYFRVGGVRARSDATDSRSEYTSSFNGGAGVAWNFQLTQVMIDALRSTSPSSQGAVVNRDELRFSLNRDFSPRVSGFVGLRGIRTSGVEGTGLNEVRERKYYTGRTGFEWRMTRAYSLEGAYEYKWQKYQGDPTDASSNGVTLSVVYQPRRLAK